jgi:hypothetical protein
MPNITSRRKDKEHFPNQRWPAKTKGNIHKAHSLHLEQMRKLANKNYETRNNNKNYVTMKGYKTDNTPVESLDIKKKRQGAFPKSKVACKSKREYS